MNNLFNNNQIIAATRSDEEFSLALQSETEIIFDLCADILSLTKKIKVAHDGGKKLYIHVDLAEGVGRDKSGITLLKKMGIDGIISTKVNLIKLARETGLSTVQRFFIVDSKSVHTTVEAVKSSRPDMIEIMPATVGKVITRLAGELDIPIIAGGLIETHNEVAAALLSGASAVSTGARSLWNGDVK